MTKRRRRNPLVQIILIALACLLGIGSRRYAHALPGFIAAYAGDTLWALAAFLGFGLILPRVSTRTIAMLALAFSVAVELSQLYHAPWIDSIRQTTLGGLILGFGFLWSDLVCYTLGWDQRVDRDHRRDCLTRGRELDSRDRGEPWSWRGIHPGWYGHAAVVSAVPIAPGVKSGQFPRRTIAADVEDPAPDRLLTREKVLEIGPGLGRLLIPAARRVMPGGEVVGIDIQPKMIERLEPE